MSRRGGHEFSAHASLRYCWRHSTHLSGCSQPETGALCAARSHDIRVPRKNSKSFAHFAELATTHSFSIAFKFTVQCCSCRNRTGVLFCLMEFYNNRASASNSELLFSWSKRSWRVKHKRAICRQYWTWFENKKRKKEILRFAVFYSHLRALSPL